MSGASGWVSEGVKGVGKLQVFRGELGGVLTVHKVKTLNKTLGALVGLPLLQPASQTLSPIHSLQLMVLICRPPTHFNVPLHKMIPPHHTTPIHTPHTRKWEDVMDVHKEVEGSGRM